MLLGSAALGVAVHRAPALAAGTSVAPAEDTDLDGLVDDQELILGTDLGASDSDLDGFSDVEELARGSDPLEQTSVPSGSVSLSIGLTGRVVNGVLVAVIPIYGRIGRISSLSFELGVVFPGGYRYAIPPHIYAPATLGSIQPARINTERVVVLEVPFPSSIVQSLGTFSIYGTVTDPIMGGGSAAASLNLVDFGGVTVAADTSSGTSVTYAPIVPDSRIPSGWASGEICWQSASPTGMIGSSTAYEITSSSCSSSDTYCSSSACSSSVGSNVQYVDPATLLGG